MSSCLPSVGYRVKAFGWPEWRYVCMLHCVQMYVSVNYGCLHIAPWSIKLYQWAAISEITKCCWSYVTTQSYVTTHVELCDRKRPDLHQTVYTTYRENSEASPHGGAEMYRWNVVPTLTRNKLSPLPDDCSKMQSLSPALNADISRYIYLAEHITANTDTYIYKIMCQKATNNRMHTKQMLSWI